MNLFIKQKQTLKLRLSGHTKTHTEKATQNAVAFEIGLAKE